MRRRRIWCWSSPIPTWRCTPARAAVFRWSMSLSATKLVTVLYSRTDWFKVRAPHGNEGWVRRADLARTLLESGEPAPIPPYPEFASHRWELGAGYGVYNRENLVTSLWRFLADHEPRRRARRPASLRHPRQPLYRVDRRAAYLHSGMEVVFADRRNRHCLSVYPGQSATRSAAKEQRNGLRFVGCARIHHPAIFVARRLAPLRRLQRPECV